MKTKILICFFPFIANAMETQLPTHRSIRDYLIKSPDLIDGRTQRRFLDLSGLNLTSLDGLENIPDIQTITRLDLSNNNLETILDYSFLAMPHLRNLNLSFNKITTIQPLAFNGPTNLESLTLSHNNLQKVEIWLAHLYQLQSLNVSHNKITLLAPYAFRDLSNLRSLLLNNNKLKKIDPISFKGRFTTPGDVAFKMLNHLDLSENPLELSKEEDQALEDLMPSHTRIIL